jgi:hypothetical protein
MDIIPESALVCLIRSSILRASSLDAYIVSVSILLMNRTRKLRRCYLLNIISKLGLSKPCQATPIPHSRKRVKLNFQSSSPLLYFFLSLCLDNLHTLPCIHSALLYSPSSLSSSKKTLLKTRLNQLYYTRYALTMSCVKEKEKKSLNRS